MGKAVRWDQTNGPETQSAKPQKSAEATVDPRRDYYCEAADRRRYTNIGQNTNCKSNQSNNHENRKLESRAKK